MSNETETAKPKYISKYKGVLAHPADKETLNAFRSQVEGLSEAQLVAAVMEVFLTQYNHDDFMTRLNDLAKPKKVKAEPKAPAKKVAKKAAKKAPAKKAVSKKEKAPAQPLDENTRVLEDEGEPPITVVIG